MRISDWSSDVCSSDLDRGAEQPRRRLGPRARALEGQGEDHREHDGVEQADRQRDEAGGRAADGHDIEAQHRGDRGGERERSEEHTSEVQSLMRSSYAVFCLTKKKTLLLCQTTTHMKSLYKQ